MLRIFIGWDSRFPEPADVLRYSLIKYSSIPLEIRYLKLTELGIDRVYDPLASTEFTYSRFLVPHLCGYRGKAVFMDNDMLALADVKELDELPMDSLRLARGQTRLSADDDGEDVRLPADVLSAQELVEPDDHELRQTAAVDQAGGRNPNGRLSAPLPGHSRRSNRRDSARLEHARRDG